MRGMLDNLKARQAKDMNDLKENMKMFLEEKEAAWKEYQSHSQLKVSHLSEEVHRYMMLCREKAEELTEMQETR